MIKQNELFWKGGLAEIAILYCLQTVVVLENGMQNLTKNNKPKPKI